MIFVHNLYYREGRVDNEHEISLLHFIERQITCFSVEQCNKEGNEDNIVPPACQGPVHHFSPKTTHRIIWRGIFTNKKYNKLEVREPPGPWLLAGGSMQTSKARGASVTRPLLRLNFSLLADLTPHWHTMRHKSCRVFWPGPLQFWLCAFGTQWPNSPSRIPKESNRKCVYINSCHWILYPTIRTRDGRGGAFSSGAGRRWKSAGQGGAGRKSA